MPFLGSVFNPVGELDQDFEPLCYWTGESSSFTQPYHQGMVHPETGHHPIQIWPEVPIYLGYCQEFFPGGRVILFGSGKSFAVVSDGHPLTILDLRQCCTHIVVTGVNIQVVFLSRIQVCRDRCFCQATFEVIARLQFSMSPLPVDPLCSELI